MKRLLLTLAFASSAMFAQQTKGPITATKDGDASHTVVKLQSVTPGPLKFEVRLSYRTGENSLPAVATMTVTRPMDAKLATGGVLAIFDVPLDQVLSIGVSQYVLDDAEIFQ